MGGASSYYAIVFMVIFLMAVWTASKISRSIGISSIVLEIAVGLVLSPQLLGFLPSEYAECYHRKVVDCSSFKDKARIADAGTEFCDLQAYLDAGLYASPWESGFFGDTAIVTLNGHAYNVSEQGSSSRLGSSRTEGKTDYDCYENCLVQNCKLDLAMKCGTAPDILTLIGHAGVAMMIFESGMHFDFEQAKTVGLPACGVAILGTTLPLVAGTGVIMAFGYPFLDGFAAGTSLAPTSVGIALRLLHEARSLQTYFGQAIITAAFVDDILSLLLYNILFSLQGEMTAMTFLPMVSGLIFMAVAVGAGATLSPKIISYILSKVPEKKPQAKLTTHHEVLFLWMVLVLIVYAQITHLCGTHLWGCFVAGMSFATWKEAHHIWVRQTKRLTCWMIRIFFSATVAFSIPVSKLLSIEAFLKGSLMGIGPCILTKVLCAPFMGPAKFVIGWAMVGRAEFAYLIAQMAAAGGMMDSDTFSIVIWALLYATIFAPFIFRKVLDRYVKEHCADVLAAQESGEAKDESGDMVRLEDIDLKGAAA
mmetsp:Transcript_3011/g.7710  ORF Transcript_3011/g.7710 Transcript_3011/m.7710 type:complete len:535 (+) Transcript_3011:70-1674(+)